jgi:iron complex transport system ATP-binding protein
VSAPLVELTGVSHRLSGTTLLDAIDWCIEPRTHWVVLGPNGAGKTTLLRVLCGEIWPNAGGSVRRNGEERSDLRILRRGIGWVTPTLGSRIPPAQSVKETILAGGFAQTRLIEFEWVPISTAQRARAQELAELLGVASLAEREFGTLSQGEQQKTLLARALMAEPYLLVLDEPYLGLDPGARERLLEAIDTLGRDERTPSLILTTHHIEEIAPCFSHVLALKAGRALACGEKRHVLSVEMLSRLYAPSADVVQSRSSPSVKDLRKSDLADPDLKDCGLTDCGLTERDPGEPAEHFKSEMSPLQDAARGTGNSPESERAASPENPASPKKMPSWQIVQSSGRYWLVPGGHDTF